MSIADSQQVKCQLEQKERIDGRWNFEKPMKVVNLLLFKGMIFLYAYFKRRSID